MENTVKLNKGQVLDLLMDSGRSAWLVNITQRVKNSPLPVAYTTYLFHDLEEIVSASTSRVYGIATVWKGGNTDKVAQIYLQVGNTTYAFIVEGYK
jgi:hypothetical protein